MSERSVLEPGEVVRPRLDIAQAASLVKRLYGLSVTEGVELNSYDDKNFFFQLDGTSMDPTGMDNVLSNGCVLKILNSLDSKHWEAIDAQNRMILHAIENGISTPRPLPNLNNELWSLETIDKVAEIALGKRDEPIRCIRYLFMSTKFFQGDDPRINCAVHLTRDKQMVSDGKYIVRLFTYIPGKVFEGIPYTKSLVYGVGELAGKIDAACRNFSHPAFEKHKRIWSLTEVPKLTQFLFSIRDERRRGLVMSVIEQFNKRVVSRYDTLQKGVIHGDFSEQNILIKPSTDNPNDYEVAAILDFGDATTSYYVFEIGILMCYVMLGSDITCAFERAAHSLAGYLSAFKLNDVDMSVLRECVAGRLVQSLVMGAYSSSMDPENSNYLLITAPKGWDLLERFWNFPKEELLNTWKSVLEMYTIHVTFIENTALIV